jgi:hypothetical protein
MPNMMNFFLGTIAAGARANNKTQVGLLSALMPNAGTAVLVGHVMGTRDSPRPEPLPPGPAPAPKPDEVKIGEEVKLAREAAELAQTAAKQATTAATQAEGSAKRAEEQANKAEAAAKK